MTGLDPALTIAENYRRFARREAAGRSPAYERLADAVADDESLLAFLRGLDARQRQPNLLFAAARFLLGAIPEPGSLTALVRSHPSELSEVMRTRRTQTNEAARCAALLPALAMLPGPIALLEVGAAAGLTLLPDFYSYEYEDDEGRVIRVAGRDPGAPVLRCRVSGAAPLPAEVPNVVWRAGIDLNPLNPGNADDMTWLECLIWPGQDDRVDRLRAASALARRYPVDLHPGDLLEELDRVADAAPAEATLVIYHTAVLAYVEEDRRLAFADAARRIGAAWLSNEAQGVLPGVRAPILGDGRDGFLLVRDGRHVLAQTDPHGTWLDWLEAPQSDAHEPSRLPPP